MDGRWHRRALEEDGSFSSSKNYLSSKKLRMAAKMSKSQSEVWDHVAETQANLSESLGKSLHADASPTSYQLSVEDEDLLKRKHQYRAALAKIIEEKPDAVGYAFAINGEINTADAYGSGILFRKLWSKLLDAPAFEGFFQSTRESSVSKNPLRPAAVSLQPQTPKPVTRVDPARERVLHPAHSAR